MFKRASWLAAVALAIAAAGCSGSDGAQGPAGAQGAPGAQGVPGPVTQTQEACMVCHQPGAIAQIADKHPGYSPNSGFVALLPDTKITINSVGFDAAGHVLVDFSLADTSGAITTISTSPNELTVVAAGLDPSLTVTGAGSVGGFYNQWMSEPPRGGTRTAGQIAPVAAGEFLFTSNTKVTSIPAGTAVQRLMLQVVKAGHNPANAFFDFDAIAAVAGASNIAPTASTTTRDIIPTSACNQCHIARIGDYGHGTRTDTRACVLCHSPLLSGHTIAADRADLPSFIHRIHSGIATAATGTGVTYPGDMRDCTFCHQQDLAMPKGNQGLESDRWETNPNAQACTSCHTTINLATGAGHKGGPQKDDSGCFYCHGPSGQAPVALFHTTTPASGDPTYDVSMAPEYVVSMSISPPANVGGKAPTWYVAGETPVVTIQFVKNGQLMPATFYTQKKDAAVGVQNDQLTTASLYVYGPRSKPMPVLTTGAAKTPVPTQGQSLFVGGTDPQVATTTANGGAFVYKLTKIPTIGTGAGQMAAGTYMVRFYAADYGYVTDSNFRVSSNAFQTIQIGTANVEPKIDGDACSRCHGTGNLPGHNMRHAVQFNSDECVSCHDLSGNYATPLANRVHSVHAASKLGDLFGIDWTTTTSLQLASGAKAGPVTYPVGDGNGGIRNCAVCHTTNNPAFTANIASFSCRGCHADKPAELSHIQQSGGQ